MNCRELPSETTIFVLPGIAMTLKLSSLYMHSNLLERRPSEDFLIKLITIFRNLHLWISAVFGLIKCSFSLYWHWI